MREGNFRRAGNHKGCPYEFNSAVDIADWH